ncbi:hypothetical protein GCM10028820_11700 [Tessaracoccus terricola]
MSNNQWNNGQADGQWQPQGNQEWNAGEQPQGSANDWNAAQDQTADWNPGAQPQGSAQEWNPAASQQDWNAGAQQPAQDWNAQPQGSADWNQQQPAQQDWNAQPQASASQQDWNAQPQGSADWNAQPQSSADWNAQPQGSTQDWNQQQPAQQDWNAQPQGGADWNQQPAQDWNQQGQQNWNQQGGFQGAPGFGGQPGQQWPAQQPAGGGNAFANVFDFSFKKLALPSAGGTIFLVAVICFALWWVFDLVQVLTMGMTLGSMVLSTVVGGLARMVIGILLTRVLIEGMSALVKLSEKSDEAKDDAAS